MDAVLLVGVVCLMYLADWLVSRKYVTSKFEATNDQKLLSRYRRWGNTYTGLIVPFLPAVGFVVYHILHHRATAHFSLLSSDGYLVPPSPAAWMIIAGFTSIVLCSPLIDLIFRLSLKERSAEFYAYLRSSGKIVSNIAVITAFLSIFLFGTGIFYHLALDQYYLFTDDVIIMDPLLSLEEQKIPYHRVRKLHDVREDISETDIISPGFIITLDNGKQLVIDEGNYDWGNDRARDERIMRFVAERSHVKLHQLPMK